MAAGDACVNPKLGSLMVKDGVVPVAGTLLAIVMFVPFASLPAVAVTLRGGVPLVVAAALNTVTAVLIAVARPA